MEASEIGLLSDWTVLLSFNNGGKEHNWFSSEEAEEAVGMIYSSC